MTNKIAFVFPGQGAQCVGMGKDLYENNSAAKALYDKADEVLGRNISKICFEGPDEDLKQTVNTQPAILTTSLAALEALKEQIKQTPAFVAGHSLGEYGALYEAGVLSLDETLKLIQKRADAMSKSKGGSMAAVLALSDEKVVEVLKGVESGYVDVANYNCPGQVVITGEEVAIDEASELLSAAGAKRVIKLAVSGAFHSKKMSEASEEFKKVVENTQINNSTIPVITNVDALATTSAADFKEKMPLQIVSSVYWTQSIQYMISQGVDTFIEIGPGKVLAGLIKKINSEVRIFNVNNMETLNACVSELNK